jgi:GT2 family glycosyltransferase
MSHSPTIGVAIVSLNTRELLGACLRSLGACTLPLVVVVVDNGSTDGSQAMLRAQFPDVRLIEPGRNLGFAAGTNCALQALLGHDPAGRDPELLLLLNPDTVVQAGALEALAAFLAAHPRVGAVGPRLLNTDGTIQAAAFRFPTVLMSALDLFPPGELLPGRLYNSWWHGRYPQERQSSAPFPIDHPLGACIMARRTLIEQVGMLDESYFMYAEEIDWALRVRQAGWSIWQVPSARVVHVGGASTSQFRTSMLVALYASRLQLFRRYYPPLVARMHRLVIGAGMLRASLLAWRAYARGRLGRDELRARLWAFGKVIQLL